MSNENNNISWLHLSDLHVFSGADKDSMLRRFENLARKLKPDFIVVTGDFQHQTYKNNASYTAAKEYLNTIINYFNLEKKDVFLVPGNHDASDKDIIARKFIIGEILKDEDKELVNYEKYSEQYNLCNAFCDYNSFVSGFINDTNDIRVKNPSEPFIYTWQNKLNIFHINTALISDGEEHFEIVDIDKISRLCNDLNNGCPTIMIGHHGLDALFAGHQKRLRNYFDECNISAYLHGDIHQYRNQSGYTPEPFKSVPEIACGKSAPQPNDTYSDVGVIYYEWNTETNRTTVYAYKWRPNGFSLYSEIPFIHNIDENFSFPMKSGKNELPSAQEKAEPVAKIINKENPHGADSEIIVSAQQEKSTLKLSSVYWVGTRLSDIDGIADKFKGYIVLFGDKHIPEENKYVMCPAESLVRVDHNDLADVSQDKFFADSMYEIVEKDHTAQFVFYNPASGYRLGFEDSFIRDHIRCLNDIELLNRINNKASFRAMMQADDPDPENRLVAMLPVLKRDKINCDYEKLLQEKKTGGFKDTNNYNKFYNDYIGKPVSDEKNIRFILQAPISSGGSGTFIMNRNNAQYLLSSLDSHAKYLVSVFHTKNIPVNVHVLIDKFKFVILPASVQLECEVEIENKLLYKGADFPAYRQLAKALRQQFIEQVKVVAEQLKNHGYRGIFGVDAIIHDGRVNILEVNARYQASTELINRALLEKGKKSVHELNLQCFSDTGLSAEDVAIFDSLSINFSNFSFSNEGHPMHDSHIFANASAAISQKNKIVIQADGYSEACSDSYIVQAHLFRLVFPGSIASISEDGTVWINENITPPESWLYRKIKAREKLAVKIALLIQGINVEGIPEKLRPATNDAIDLQIGEKNDGLMIINSPINKKIRHIQFTPFSLVPSEHHHNKYLIKYYGEPLIDNVKIFPADLLQTEKCTSGKMYSEIAYLSTDRLRVHLTNACKYKLSGTGCKFCNIIENNNSIAIKDIEEVVDAYIKDRDNKKNAKDEVKLEHFLIGGQSLNDCDQKLIETAKVLCKYHLPIYVMTLPLAEATVRELVKLGVLEFAYNIEIFDNERRKKFMPGKSETSKEEYFKKLKMTRQVLNGANYPPMMKVVRSIVIVGLEPWETMITGIQNLIDIHVEPMLSIFRPLPGSELSHLNAPPIKMVYELYHLVNEMLYKSSKIDDEELIEWSYNSDRLDGKISNYRKLGPECPCCQNNTVSLPWEIQKAVIRRAELTVNEDAANFPADA